MAQLRVFLSSTAYDLNLVRSHLRSFLEAQGHVPVMSDFADILYDPNQHAHHSCVQELKTCDVVVLIIGSKFGSAALPEFVEDLATAGGDEDPALAEFLKDRKLSVTQLEAVTAFSENIPVFTFIDAGVDHDLRVYEANAAGGHADSIVYPAVPDAGLAKYIFQFIQYVKGRTTGNAYFTFEKIADIETTLARQWSALLQRLLLAERSSRQQAGLIEEMSERLDDLKSAVLATIDGPDSKRVARGIVRFRSLVELLLAIGATRVQLASDPPPDWRELLHQMGIDDLLVRDQFGSERSIPSLRMGLARRDGRVTILRMTPSRFFALEAEWTEFVNLDSEARAVISEALVEQEQRARYLVGDTSWHDAEADGFRPFGYFNRH